MGDALSLGLLLLGFMVIGLYMIGKTQGNSSGKTPGTILRKPPLLGRCKHQGYNAAAHDLCPTCLEKVDPKV